MRSLIPLCLLICSCFAYGEFAPPGKTPVARLIKNINNYIKEHPKDPQGYYILARAHSMAFVHKRNFVATYGQNQSNKLPYIAHRDSQTWVTTTENEKLDPASVKKHLIASLTNYQQTLKLAPQNPLYNLGYAYTIREGIYLASEVEVLGIKQHKDKQKALNQWKEIAINHYLVAYQSAIKKDQKRRHEPLRGLASLISYEAGSSYIRLIQTRKYNKHEAQTIQQVKNGLAVLEKLQPGPVTPIIFSLEGVFTLKELLSTQTAIFDLDGDGNKEEWPWVTSRTGFLVWDPDNSGKITSGRQLFGSVTWWMFFSSGYMALSTLDDNYNGELSGTELIGLRVWFDRNADGISTIDEVVSVEKLGIVGISTKSTKKIGDSLANLQGLKMRDGRILPTYDWVTSPINAQK